MKTIKIGISRCLLGQRVRYDGADKYSRICNEDLAERFELVSVCPEVDAGLTVPRPPVELQSPLLLKLVYQACKN